MPIRFTLWFSSILFSFFLSFNIVGQGVIIHQPIDTHNEVIDQLSDDLFFIREAEMRFRQLDFEGAEMAYDNAVALYPQSAEPLIRRAIFRKRYGMEANARADLHLVHQLNPYAIDLYGVNGANGIVQVMAYEPEKALENLNSNQRVSYYYEMIDQLWMQGRIEEPKLDLLEDIVALIDQNELQEARFYCSELISNYQKSEIGWDLWGVIQLREGNLDQALVSFQEAVDLAPDYAMAWYNFGRAEKQKGNINLAKAYLDKAIKIQNNLVKAYFDRALLSKEMGQIEDAIKDYTNIIELNGDLYLQAFLNRGLAKKLQGDIIGAMTDLNHVISKTEPDPELVKNRGNLYFLFGNLNRAIEDYTEAIELNPDYADAYHNRALVYFVGNYMDSGCADLQQSASLGSSEAKVKMPFFCTW